MVCAVEGLIRQPAAPGSKGRVPHQVSKTDSRIAAEQRSQLSPRRGLVSLGVWFVKFGEQRSGDRNKGLADLSVIAVAPSGLGHVRWFVPKARKARPGPEL